MTATQQLFLDDPDSMIDWNLPGFIGRTINARAYSQREKLDLRLAAMARDESVQQYSAGNAADLPWDRYEAAARTHERAHMTHNTLWVRDIFYSRYLRSGEFRHRLYYTNEMNPEPEMAALRDLVHLLKLSKVRALFVMQPINPKLYDDVHRFDDVDARITSLCREYGMPYYDMYSQPYEEGVLRDGAHPGELGWERIDHVIAEYFRL